ncbi:hypothetical protein [Photobacterium damselae]|uniref:hypothetical protein n=1 Tax=Photobacterium damselae TaxID=38293 RepID=UPI00370CE477
MNKLLYSLLLIDKHTAIVKKTAQGWIYEAISGENWHSISSGNELINIIKKFNDKINSQYNLNKIQLTVVYDDSFSEQINQLAEILIEYHCEQWQLINYSIIAKLAGEKKCHENYLSLDKDWIISVLLPVIESRLYQDGKKNFELKMVNTDGKLVNNEREKELQEKINELQRQVTCLKQQINIQYKIDFEQLLCYLPLFYKDVWTVINPEQIALLSGNLITEINIKSPYREPDKSTLLALKKQFLRLSQQQQRYILDFCLTLEHPLEIRRDMQSILEQE